MALNPAFQETLRKLGKHAFHHKTLPHDMRGSGWSVHTRHGRIYILNEKSEDMTAACLIAGREYEKAADYVDDENIKAALLTYAKLYKLKLKQLDLMQELMQGLAYKNKKVVDRASLKYGVVNSSELINSLCARDNLEDK